MPNFQTHFLGLEAKELKGPLAKIEVGFMAGLVRSLSYIILFLQGS